MNAYYPHLFEPLTVKKVTFRNRIFSAPNLMCYLDANGFPTDTLIEYYANKAKGGAAVVTVGDTPVDHEHGASMKRPLNLCYDSLPYFAELAMAIHEHGAIASLELNHGGHMGLPEANGGNDPIGPVDYDIDRFGTMVHCRAMTEEDMNTVADHYADAAALLKLAGFDMCLVHGGHGWLLDQFLSPLFNTRTDEYGGSLENRAKFPLMVLDRIRQRVGDDFLIEYRMSGCEEIEGGLEIEEAIQFAHMLEGKVDLLHVSAGLDTRPDQAVKTHPTMFMPHGANVKYAAAIKASGVTMPVIAIGAISDPEMAEEILASGQADCVAMARALIADPSFPRKAAAGKADEIIPCLRCLDCLTGMQTGQHFQCAVNCSTGREVRYQKIKPAKEVKKVLVVGGGPGGMQAAITAAERGHQVTLAESTDSLGGLLKFTDFDELKMDLMRLKDYLVRMTERSGARILLNTTVDEAFVAQGGYDAVIIATGSTPAKPPVPGLNEPWVRHATDIYTELESLGKRVVVLGGGLVGCETGLFLASLGHEVDIIEMQGELAPEANWMHKVAMMQTFAQSTAEAHTGHRVTRIVENGVYAANADGEERFFEADSIVYAMGMRPNNALSAQLTHSAQFVRSVGDCVRARKARHAMMEGFWAAIDLN